MSTDHTCLTCSTTGDRVVHRRPRPLWDRAGTWVSALCLLHCLALPVAALALPYAAREALHKPTHAAVFVLALPLALLAFSGGYRYHHRGLPAVLGFAGVGLLASGLLLFHHEVEAVASIAGGLLLVVGHVLNHRYSVRESRRTAVATG
jgi:hypothetical protein